MSELKLIAEIAVSSPGADVDKLYSYLIPADLIDVVLVGQRVIVPFGRANKQCQGFIITLDIKPAFECDKLKNIAYVFSNFSLTKDDLQLAAFLKNRCFCSLFDAANTLMPPGVWNLSKSRALPKFQKDKLILTACLAMPLDQAEELIPSGKVGERRLEVLRCLAQAECLPEKELSYLTGAGSALIKGLAEKGFINLYYADAYERPDDDDSEAVSDILLSPQQEEAYKEIKEHISASAKGVLLHGVTGSGKTEIYIKLIRDVLNCGKTAILLVPEIALTPQTVRRFCLYFKDDIAIMHSGLTSAQRIEEYKKIKAGNVRIVVGTRSAVFAPLTNIGIIIIDEEQEFTYKSENVPKYHAVDVAKFRAVSNKCLVLLGSATPSVESYWKAENGSFSLVKLSSRYNEMPLPETIISDMRGRFKNGFAACIGKELKQEIAKNLQRGEKTILFLNRRGASRRVVCIDCGYTPECKRCSVSLVYHSKNGRLLCHHCGYSESALQVCPECGSTHLKYEGMGTQRVEEELKELFKGIRIIRMDADTIVGRTSHEKLLDEFVNGDYDVLLGTQMVAKGLDFKNVTLVGVLDSDGFIFSGDFRAQERAFSLITQVVGRAGRHEIPGRAVIQTFSPDNFVINTAALQNYEDFYKYEISARNALRVPPFEDIFVFTLSGESEDKVQAAACSLAATIDGLFKSEYKNIGHQVLGPIAPYIAKLNEKFRLTVTFRGRNNSRTRSFVHKIIKGYKKTKHCRSVSVSIDINPYN